MNNLKVIPLFSDSDDESILVKYACVTETDIIGFFSLNFRKDFKECFLEKMDVDYYFRNKGYGTFILNLIFSVIKQMGIEKILLYVSCDNDKAQRLYKRLGFITVETDLLEFCYKMEKEIR